MRIRLTRTGSPLTFEDVIALWREDEEFRGFFIELLEGSRHAAFFWELPALTIGAVGRPFECVLVDAPALAEVPADPTPFDDRFATAADGEVLTFPNLGGDATLVVPAPCRISSAGPAGRAHGSAASAGSHAHLAAFSRTAPMEQQHALWSAVGRAVEALLGERPLWLSTSGLGVFWLHVRLDTFPKYITHREYRAGV